MALLQLDRSKESKVPVLITGDVDFSKHHVHEEKLRSFDLLLDAATQLSIPMTFFFVSKEADEVHEYPHILATNGHEIGCHGLTHGDEEEYNRMPIEMQDDYLYRATQNLQSVTGTEILSFRAPRVKIGAQTFQILEKLGYRVDSSVCSQRCDIVSSNLINIGWLSAPRLPYFPSTHSPYRRGDFNVLEVPVSALGLPFISSVLYVFGLQFMKMFFRVLYAESRRTGKPIVYLFHPYEFATEIPGARNYRQNFLVHGLQIRRHLYRGTPLAKYRMTVRLLEYMRTFPETLFMTMSDYEKEYGESANGKFKS